MNVRAWVCSTLAYSLAAFAGETPVETAPPPPAASFAPATPSQPVAPSQPAAPSPPQTPSTIPVVATDANRAAETPPTAASPTPSLKSNAEYFCQTLAANGDHRTKYVSRVFPSAATSQSLTAAWLDYLQTTYRVDRNASGSCARVTKTFEETLPDREKQWRAMSFNVVHVDWKG